MTNIKTLNRINGFEEFTFSDVIGYDAFDELAQDLFN